MAMMRKRRPEKETEKGGQKGDEEAAEQEGAANKALLAGGRSEREARERANEMATEVIGPAAWKKEGPLLELAACRAEDPQQEGAIAAQR